MRVLHEPLLSFLSLWHCRGVRIYWDFSLGQAMTAEGPHKEREGKRGEREETISCHAARCYKTTQGSCRAL